MAKTTCAITREEFHQHAKPVELTITGNSDDGRVKEFSTGSLGWYLNSKTIVKIGDKTVTVQIGLNMTIVGSKELPK